MLVLPTRRPYRCILSKVPLLDWYPSSATWPTPVGWPSLPALPFSNPGPSSKSLEICRRYNKGHCNQTRCRYQHVCSFCRAPHPGEEPLPSQANAQGPPASISASLGHHYMYEYLGLSRCRGTWTPSSFILLLVKQYTI